MLVLMNVKKKMIMRKFNITNVYWVEAMPDKVQMMKKQT